MQPTSCGQTPGLARSSIRGLFLRSRPPVAAVDRHLERLFLENDFHSFARELRTGEAPLT